jgi:hypothetical protein
MFFVKWFIRGESLPVETEAYAVHGSDVILQACQYRLTEMRLKHPRGPPDGFVVFDSKAHEVGRWFLSQPRSSTSH